MEINLPPKPRGQSGRLLFLWDNFGPLHIDRCEAAACAFGYHNVLAVEMFSVSDVYSWNKGSSDKVKRVTIAKHSPLNIFAFLKMTFVIFESKPTWVFLCHYQMFEIFLLAIALRFAGVKVFSMNDSKYDDYGRVLTRELLKSIMLMPYNGSLVGGSRSAGYLEFLGINAKCIAKGYDTVSVERLNRTVRHTGEQFKFAERQFIVVARLVAKKNIELVIDAFSLLQEREGPRRKLVICGDGPLEHALKDRVGRLDLGEAVEFKGFLQTADVAFEVSRSLCLILPSTEEQFGQVVAEAIALQIPVLVSSSCGARDDLVRTGVNGFIFEPDNAVGLAYFMELLSLDEGLWRRMVEATARFVEHVDVSAFVEGVAMLTGMDRRK